MHTVHQYLWQVLLSAVCVVELLTMSALLNRVCVDVLSKLLNAFLAIARCHSSPIQNSRSKHARHGKQWSCHGCCWPKCVGEQCLCCQSLHRRLNEPSFCTFKPPVSTHIATTSHRQADVCFCATSGLTFLLCVFPNVSSEQCYDIPQPILLQQDVCFCATSGFDFSPLCISKCLFKLLPWE